MNYHVNTYKWNAGTILFVFYFEVFFIRFNILDDHVFVLKNPSWRWFRSTIKRAEIWSFGFKWMIKLTL